jgi:hypothetical protein
LLQQAHVDRRHSALHAVWNVDVPDSRIPSSPVVSGATTIPLGEALRL